MRKRHMPPPSRNLFEFSGVSSVRFHKVNQVISIIVSQVPSLGKELGMIRVVLMIKLWVP